jgi:hypothetical protein
MPPELREQLIEMARGWMHAVIDEEDESLNRGAAAGFAFIASAIDAGDGPLGH